MRRARATGLDLVLDPQRAEASLWRRARFEDDVNSRETLFNRYVVLARSVAARLQWRRRTVERGDLEQFAYEGLLQAIDRFDPLLGVPFGAYARPRIAGNIADGMAHMTEVGTQLSQRRRRQQERLQSLDPVGRAPGDALAVLADVVVDLALGLMLEGTGMLAAGDGADPRPSAYEGLAWRQTQAAITQALGRLPAGEQAVVRQHYQNGLSFAHIADLLRLSRGRVSQLHKAALERLRRWLRHY